MSLLRGPLNGVGGVRQVVDTIDSFRGSTSNLAQAGVFEYLENDLHKFHITDERSLTLNQIRACARQLLRGLRQIHQKDIVHTGTPFPYDVKTIM